MKVARTVASQDVQVDTIRVSLMSQSGLEFSASKEEGRVRASSFRVPATEILGAVRGTLC